MKKTIQFLTGFFLFVTTSNMSFAQLDNSSDPNDGKRCKIKTGTHSGEEGTMDDGFCCVVDKLGDVFCSECVGDRCDILSVAIIRLDHIINGNWTVSTDKSGKTSAISVSKNIVSVNMSSYGRPAAKGVLINKNTIRITFPDKKLSVFGKITSANTIVWSNGTTWVKKPAVALRN